MFIHTDKFGVTWGAEYDINSDANVVMPQLICGLVEAAAKVARGEGDTLTA